MGKSVLPQPVIILVTPCYIIICNAFAFTGRELHVIIGYPECRFACPGLSARWAFSPLCQMTRITNVVHQTGIL